MFGIRRRCVRLTIITCSFLLFIFVLLINYDEIKERTLNYKNKDVYTKSQWVINKNVLQYSSYLNIRDRDIIEVESLVILNQIDKSKLKCVLYTNNTKLIVLNVLETIKIPLMNGDNLQKVKCTVRNNDSLWKLIGNFRVAVLDYDEEINFEFIVFQIPTIVDARLPKQKSKN
jgi:hypothetical protein